MKMDMGWMQPERRGVKMSTDRQLLYCAGCGKTSAFERRIEGKEVKLVCIGDQRAQRPGCGKILTEDQHRG